jgi:hypothetical protein
LSNNLTAQRPPVRKAITGLPDFRQIQAGSRNVTIPVRDQIGNDLARYQCAGMGVAKSSMSG